MKPAPKRPRRQQSPSELERMLKSTAGEQSVHPTVRREAMARLAAIRRNLQRRTCSSTWESDCWATGQIFPPPADTTPMLPCRCPACQRTGRLWPGHYAAPGSVRIELVAPAVLDPQCLALPTATQRRHSIVSYECHLESLGDWEAANLPSSPSGLALRAVREGRIKLRRQRTRLGSRRKSS